MKKILYTFAVIVVAFFTVSCGGNKKTITPKMPELRGDLKEYFKVVEKDYTLDLENESNIISIEIEKIKELPFDKATTKSYNASGKNVNRHIGFGIKILDKEGGIVEQTAPNATGLNGIYSSDDVENFLNTDVGEIGVVRWRIRANKDQMKTMQAFEITSATENLVKEVPTSSSSTKSTTKTSTTPPVGRRANALAPGESNVKIDKERNVMVY